MNHIRRAAALAAAIAAISTTAASAQKYYAREQLTGRGSPAATTPEPEPTAPTTPSSKADCTGPVYNKALLVYRREIGSATTPYLFNDAWRGPATEICNGFDYGGSGSCTAYRYKNDTVVHVEGFKAADVHGTDTMSNTVGTQMILTCVNR